MVPAVGGAAPGARECLFLYQRSSHTDLRFCNQRAQITSRPLAFHEVQTLIFPGNMFDKFFCGHGKYLKGEGQERRSQGLGSFENLALDGDTTMSSRWRCYYMQGTFGPCVECPPPLFLEKNKQAVLPSSSFEKSEESSLKACILLSFR